ncbi:hypothetical protein [Microtetraspora malaysiensis]|uniref:hypothetical protein n=1 Tax=Microtetraspora malaysiensis TaxID=161358 RepID=UPI003D93935C
MRTVHASDQNRSIAWTLYQPSAAAGHQRGDRINVIALPGIVGHSVGANEAAHHASMNDHQPLVATVIDPLRAHQSAALCCSISWFKVNVLGPQAHRTVIAITPIDQRQHPGAAVLTHEALILGSPADGLCLQIEEVIFNRSAGFRSLSPP